MGVCVMSMSVSGFTGMFVWMHRYPLCARGDVSLSEARASLEPSVEEGDEVLGGMQK